MKNSAPAIFIVLGLLTGTAGATTVTFTTSGNWTVPAGVSSVTVEAWGHGGAGGGATSNSGPFKGGGGAGGQYARSVVAVTPGATIPYTVGTAGTGSNGDGSAGGDTVFGSNVVVAKGGAGGLSYENGGAGGVGSTVGGVGGLIYAGGSGSAGGATSTGGAGGGGAGSGGAGGDAAGNTAGTGTATGGGTGGAGLTVSGAGAAGSANGGGGSGGYVSGSNTNRNGGAGGNAQVVLTFFMVPMVSSINLASFNPTANNRSVTWTVTFTQSVTGVDVTDFSLIQTGGAAGASITSVTGSGTSWTVVVNTGTGVSGSLGLNLRDDNSIVAGSLQLGGAGLGDGNFTGQTYTILPSPCTGAADIIFCDDFERANPGSVGNGWTTTPAAGSVATCAANYSGNTGCAGVDSDIPPFTTYTNPRPNPSRAMFTRWTTVTVQSPTINLLGKSGAQLSFWMRRGDDSFSECPEATGENYLLKYLASDNTWKILAQYPAAPSAQLCAGGPVYLPVIELPTDALHANFAMQFYQPSGSGNAGGGANGGAPGVVGYDYWHMDDVIIRDKPAPSFVGAFCDNFEAGLGRWSITAEGAPNGANIGDAAAGTITSQSTNHSLTTRWGYVSASTFKTNIVGVTGNISYWVRVGMTAAMKPAANENLVVEYLNSSGNWLNLATYLGSAAAGTIYNGSFAIPADAKHANFRLRFRQLAGSGYDKSYWHVDDVCVGDLLPTADLALIKTGDTLVPGSNTSYTLNASNNGPGTLAGSMKIEDTLPAGLSFVSGTGTGWSCGAVGQLVTCNWSGTLTPGNAAPTLTLRVAVGAGVSGTITNTALLSGTVNDPVPDNNTAHYATSLFIPSYAFTDNVCTSGVAFGAGANPCNLVSWSPQTAGASKTGVYITAVNASNVPTQLSASTTTTLGLQFALSCSDPTTDAGVQATFTAAGSPGTLPLCAPNGGTPTTWSSSNSQTFAVGNPSVGPFTFNYADVGDVELWVRNSAATTQMAASGKFVVKPAGFVLSAIKTASMSNPAAADAAGAAFVKAGAPFSVTVTAVNSLGNATPNYGMESSPESVQFVDTSLLSTDSNYSNHGTLIPGLGLSGNPVINGTFGPFVSGVATGTTFSWDEVGIIRLTPAVGDGDYLKAGNVLGTVSGNVGRFYPDHFDTTVTAPMSCPGLTCPGNGLAYSGQAFTTSVTAKNALCPGSICGTTQNYAYSATAANNFARDVTLSAVVSSGGAVSGAGTITAGTPMTASVFAAGSGTLATTVFTFTNAATAPTDVFIRATDAETTSLRTVAKDSVEGGLKVASGRIKVSNAYGSELLPLTVIATAQYYTATGWVNSITDAITSLTLAGSYDVVKNGSVAGTTTPVPTGAITLIGGQRSIVLGKPSNNATGIATISPTKPSYLPLIPGTATFGVYKSNNGFIYRRESY